MGTRLMSSSDSAAPTDLHPQLLYRVDGDAARFATWRLAEGHEAVAIFSTTDTAKQYRTELSQSAGWNVIQPERDKLIKILNACRAAGILYAALDPLGGSAKTLFDIPRVLAAVDVAEPPSGP
jgi:hypothetical protein